LGLFARAVSTNLDISEENFIFNCPKRLQIGPFSVYLKWFGLKKYRAEAFAFVRVGRRGRRCQLEGRVNHSGRTIGDARARNGGR